MTRPSKPILWSFRRCPYAMRARLAVHASGVPVELREILLRDKPAAFLAASAKATVPVLQTPDGVINQSFDIMIWALGRSDQKYWLATPGHGFDLIAECDGPLKSALDRCKYHVRYPDVDLLKERHIAGLFLRKLDAMLQGNPFLFGKDPTLADYAILPFVRQFAGTDRAWFDQQDWPDLIGWLDRFTASAAFGAVMQKYPPWQSGTDGVSFP